MKKKKIPKFKSEAEEREFWAKEDSAEYIDWENAGKVMLPKLKPSLKTISLRLPENMLAELKLLANKRDIPMRPMSKKAGQSPAPVVKSLRYQISSSKSACWGPTPMKGRGIYPVCEKAKCSLEWQKHWVIHNLFKS